MDEDLEDFINHTRPKQSKLMMYKKEITFLKEKNYSVQQIAKFLRDYKSVTVSSRTVDRFCKDELSSNKITVQDLTVQKVTGEQETSASDFFVSRAFKK